MNLIAREGAAECTYIAFGGIDEQHYQRFDGIFDNVRCGIVFRGGQFAFLRIRTIVQVVQCQLAELNRCWKHR